MKALNQSTALHAASEPLFWHPDFNMRNIFVDEADPTQITGIIDWQSAGISPAFMYALDTPDFGEELPYDEDLDGKDKTPDEKLQLAREDADRCSVAFAVCAEVTPKFRTARNLAPSIARPLIFCDALWRSGAAMLRRELLDLSKDWHEMGLPGQCPYQAREDEEEMQEQHFDDFKSVQRLKSFLARAFHGNTDGWVPTSEYDEARQKVDELYKSWLTSATSDGDMKLSKAEAIWPWTVR